MPFYAPHRSALLAPYNHAQEKQLSTREQEKLLDTLSENSLVKAAVVVDHNGYIKARSGDASVFNSDAPAREPGSKPTENIYLVALTKDILAVAFNDDTDFERLRKSVDTLIEHSGLALVEDDDD